MASIERRRGRRPRLSGDRVVATTRVAPSALATWTPTRPMLDVAPVTSTLSPAVNPAVVRAPCSVSSAVGSAAAVPGRSADLVPSRCPLGSDGVEGGQGEKVRVPQASGTLVTVPAGFDEALVPSLLSLSDVMSTGYHAAKIAGVDSGQSVTVIGDGAVGLCSVISAKLLGAGQIILMGRHQTRTDLGLEFGATDVIARARRRGHREGEGAHERRRHARRPRSRRPRARARDGHRRGRDGGLISRVGAPQFATVPLGFGEFMRNITLTGGVAPARAYIDELLPQVLDGSIEPGKVFDQTVDLDGVPGAYQAMADRKAVKVLVRP